MQDLFDGLSSFSTTINSATKAFAPSSALHFISILPLDAMFGKATTASVLSGMALTLARAQDIRMFNGTLSLEITGGPCGIVGRYCYRNSQIAKKLTRRC